MSSDSAKRAAAEAALAWIEAGDVVGVGTGSTVNFFIDALAGIKERIDGAVSSSEASAERLKQHGIRVLDLNNAGQLPLYVDGADEVTRHGAMIKGGGAALTREKIVAEASDKFICIVDQSKLVKMLGKFPLPVEVIPMARSMVARRLVALGGMPQYREGVITDNGNIILDVLHLDLTDPTAMEQQLNAIPGVVCNGIFARNKARHILVGGDNGVETIAV